MAIRVIYTMVLVLLLQACAEPLPEAPDVSETLEAYDRGPTVDFGAEQIVQEVLASQDFVELAQLLRAIGLVIKQVEDVLGPPTPDQPGPDPSRPGREGVVILGSRFFFDIFAEVRHVCEGHDPEVTQPDPDTNGTLTIKLRSDESAFEGSFWGEFQECRLLASSSDLGPNTLVLDGPVSLELLEPVRFDDVPLDYLLLDYLFEFDGTIDLNDVRVLNGKFDFQVLRDVGIVVRFVLGEGEQFFVVQPADNPNALELRTRSETWQCDFERRRCLSSGGIEATW